MLCRCFCSTSPNLIAGVLSFRVPLFLLHERPERVSGSFGSRVAGLRL